MDHRTAIGSLLLVVAACANGSVEADTDTNTGGVELDDSGRPASPYGDLDAGRAADRRAEAANGALDATADEPLPPPDAGVDVVVATCVPPVPGGVCGTVPQCGCPAHFTCDVTGSAGITECEPAGAVAAYQACGSPNQCQPGLTCMDGACKPFCLVDGDCPGAGRSCAQVNYGSFPVPKFLICTSACDPVNPAAICGVGLSCFATSATTSDCIGPVGAAIGPGTCNPQMLAACAPGYVCSGVDCLKWCRITMNDCPTGQTCTPLPSGAVTLAGTPYGACQ